METYIIHESSEYEKFSFDSANRPVDPKKVDRLVALIREKNLLAYYPLVVSPTNVIQDGQHRFCAAKRLGVSFYFLVSQGMNLQDVADASSVQSGWKSSDQLHHYCERGFKHYITLREFMRKYPWLTIVSAAHLISLGDRKFAHIDFKHGLFVANGLRFGVQVANSILDFAPYISYYREASFISAIRNLHQNRNYDHARMVRKLKFLSAKLRKCPDVPSYIQILDEIYNYKEPESRKVPLKKLVPGQKDFVMPDKDE